MPAVALVALAVGAGACGSDADAPANRRAVYRNLATNVISPLYNRLEEVTDSRAVSHAEPERLRWRQLTG